ncbi:MAG: hypothetical protein RBR71_10980 [Gudongella sp.]|nr:hypothetical protein [Gudongella sp.]
MSKSSFLELSLFPLKIHPFSPSHAQTFRQIGEMIIPDKTDEKHEEKIENRNKKQEKQEIIKEIKITGI